MNYVSMFCEHALLGMLATLSHDCDLKHTCIRYVYICYYSKYNNGLDVYGDRQQTKKKFQLLVNSVISMRSF